MTSSKTMEVISLQLPSQKSYQKNLDGLLSLLSQHQDKALIIAPEVCLTAFDYEHIAEAADFSKKALEILKENVGEQIVVLTLILKEENGFVNLAVVIHRHKIVHQQRKSKLFTLGDEDRYFLAGRQDEIALFEIEGVKYALLICFELRFKELWRQIEGADVVLIPARWGLPRKSHLVILSRALAVMNQCYVIVSNSSDADMASASAIISPNGEVVQQDGDDCIEGTVDRREITKMRRYIVMN